MPTYLITDNNTGKKYELNADYPPTQEQITNLIDKPEEREALISATQTVSDFEPKANKTPPTAGLGKSDQVGSERENAIINQQKKINSFQANDKLPANTLR